MPETEIKIFLGSKTRQARNDSKFIAISEAIF
jgi:hypothetical protein